MNSKKAIWLSAAGFGVVLGAEVYLYLQVRSLGRDNEKLKWQLVEEVIRQQEDQINIEVGVIQFLRKGYSIQLERANYTADGLSLRGYVGNPTNLWISNLTLNFSAGKPLDQYEGDFLAALRGAVSSRSGTEFHMNPIGASQSSPVTSLAPGTRQPFEVTIPNVKQTKEVIRLTVWFSGELYEYRLP